MRHTCFLIGLPVATSVCHYYLIASNERKKINFNET